MKILVLTLFLIGCKDDPKAAQMAACDQMCRPNRVLTFDGNSGTCTCAHSTGPDTEAGRFCADCLHSCGTGNVKACKFGNDTWGAGPDVCECGHPVDGGVP